MPQRVSFPRHSLLEGLLPRTDYADAYQVLLPHPPPPDLEGVVRAALASPPRWIKLLMGIRDGVVGRLGLKTQRRGELFPVLERSAEEVVFGLDDHHLDFRGSLLRQSSNGRCSLVFATVVQFNNGWGRLYFSLIRPFHGVVVKALLRHIALFPALT